MKRRRLHPEGPSVPPIVLGTMAYGRDPDLRERAETIRYAVKAGVRALDTAPLYSFGHIEQMLGDALEGLDVDVFGKVGLRWDDDYGDVLFSAQIDGRRVTVRKDSRPQSVRKDVERSLLAMRRETLTLCQVHHPDVHTPLAETMGELLRLRDEGKIEHIGVSNFSPAQLDEAQAALGDVPLCSHQFEFSLLARQGRAGVRACEQRGLGALLYSPLHRGALAGNVAQRGLDVHGGPRRSFPPFVWPNALQIDDAIARGVRPVALRHHATAAQIALAWLLHEPGVTAVIAGMRNTSQAQASIEAASIRLAHHELVSIERAFESVQIDRDAKPRKRDRVRNKLRNGLAKVTRKLGR